MQVLLHSKFEILRGNTLLQHRYRLLVERFEIEVHLAHSVAHQRVRVEEVYLRTRPIEREVVVLFQAVFDVADVGNVGAHLLLLLAVQCT